MYLVFLWTSLGSRTTFPFLCPDMAQRTQENNITKANFAAKVGEKKERKIDIKTNNLMDFLWIGFFSALFIYFCYESYVEQSVAKISSTKITQTTLIMVKVCRFNFVEIPVFVWLWCAHANGKMEQKGISQLIFFCFRFVSK